MTTDKQREAFEAWHSDRYQKLSAGDNAKHKITKYWQRVAWQAALQSQSARIEELETICAEAYQVVGQFSDMLPDAKILDNLSQQRLVHTDVLPFKPVQSPEAQKLVDAAYKARHGGNFKHPQIVSDLDEALQPFTKG